MATIGLWKIENRLDKVINYTISEEKTVNEDFVRDMHRVINYTTNDYKTEKQFYVSTLNCDLETAANDMKMTKKRFNKTDGILAYHGFQSFKPGEVTPEVAHEIGVQLAEEIWGDRFEVVISTHLNTDKVHNHFVVNSVSFKDGKKYYDNRTSYAKIRHVSDCLCEEHGLSVLEEKPTNGAKINYANYYKGEVARSTYHSIAKEDLDRAIGQAYDYKDFIHLMQAMNYEVINRYGKLSIRRYPYKKNIRIERCFGDDYTIANINTRIQNTHIPREPFPEARGVHKIFINKPENKKRKVKGIYGLFMYYCYLLKVFPTEYPNKRLSPEIRADIKKMDKISKETNWLVSNKIETKEQLLEFKSDIKLQLDSNNSNRELMWKKYNRTGNPQKKENIKKDINNLSEKIDLLKEEYDLCTGIEERIPVITSKVKKIDDEKVKEVDINEHIK